MNPDSQPPRSAIRQQRIALPRHSKAISLDKFNKLVTQPDQHCIAILVSREPINPSTTDLIALGFERHRFRLLPAFPGHAASCRSRLCAVNNRQDRHSARWGIMGPHPWPSASLPAHRVNQCPCFRSSIGHHLATTWAFTLYHIYKPQNRAYRYCRGQYDKPDSTRSPIKPLLFAH